MSRSPIPIRKLSVDELVGPVPQDALYTPPSVRVSFPTIRSIFRHVERFPSQEVGGLLVGQLNFDRKIMEIEITGAIRGKAAISGFASLLFTLTTWDFFYRKKAKSFQDKVIIGWYHSHPGFGLFLSQTDQFTHRSFFYQPWHLALVLDPSCKTFAFFQTTSAGVVRLNSATVHSGSQNGS